MVSESVATSYGMTVKANIEGTALSLTEVYKRVNPPVSGYYVFDTEVWIFVLSYFTLGTW